LAIVRAGKGEKDGNAVKVFLESDEKITTKITFPFQLQGREDVES